MEMKFINTVEIGVNVPGPRLPVLAFHKLLRGLGETGDNFASIADIVLSSPQVIHVTFTEAAAAAEFLRKYEGVSQHIMEGKPTQMVFRDPNITDKFVRISDFPTTGNLEVVKRRLREFGSVLEIRRERYRQSDDYFSCLTGVVVARMSLIKAIPNYLTIGDYRTFVRYPGQPQTCRVCNQPGHVGADCPSRPMPPPAAPRQKKSPPIIWPKPKSSSTVPPSKPPALTEQNFPTLDGTSSSVVASPLPSTTPAWVPSSGLGSVSTPTVIPETPNVAEVTVHTAQIHQETGSRPPSPSFSLTLPTPSLGAETVTFPASQTVANPNSIDFDSCSSSSAADFDRDGDTDTTDSLPVGGKKAPRGSRAKRTSAAASPRSSPRTAKRNKPSATAPHNPPVA